MREVVQLLRLSFLLYLYSLVGLAAAEISKIPKNFTTTTGRPVNVLIILADDLGYGDTSVKPFMGSEILTPQLEKMAARGTIMTNFHAAAPVCTPTRASILTGMFPWRVGIKAVYEYGEKGKSNRDDWLAQVPTLAMVFREANYSTGHSGKWHVGGMRNDDWEMRKMPDRGFNQSHLPHLGSMRCPHPGPNQQGFEDYVSVLDGPGAPRQNFLQVNDCLYSQGCEYLLRNDTLIGKEGGPSGKEYLFDCEVRHAIRMMTESLAANQSFFIQVWFHAPHGPWETIHEAKRIYGSHRVMKLNDCRKMNYTEAYCQAAFPSYFGRQNLLFDKYKTMVTGMDSSIGVLLDALKTLGVERDTIVVFLSDNGPEDNAGTTRSTPYNTTSGLRGNKRFLYEGGIRVPCIWQWVGRIPKGRETKVLGISTDIFPTLLEAAKIPMPPNVHVDGISLLPELLSHRRSLKRVKRVYVERMGLWHTEYESPRATVGILFDFKVKLNDRDKPVEIFDLNNDLAEAYNLIPTLDEYPTSTIDSWSKAPEIKVFTAQAFLSHSVNRTDPWLHKFIVSKTWRFLSDYAKYGNEAHLKYLEQNKGRNYTPTVESDQRHARWNIYRTTSREQAAAIRKETIELGYCSTPCSCDIPYCSQVPALPFEKVPSSHQYINPRGLINATKILFGDKKF